MSPPHLLAEAVVPQNSPGSQKKVEVPRPLLVGNPVGLEVGPDRDIFKRATGDSTVFLC